MSETNLKIEELVVPDVHLKSCEINDIIKSQIEEVRVLLREQPLYIKYENWCTNDQLHRFLIARNYKIQESYELLMSALKWRDTRIPPEGIVGLSGNTEWEARMEKESLTGKIFVSKNLDKFGRSIVLLDNTVQNTYSVEDQQTFLAWNLDLACQLMSPNVDKYVVWVNLENFSFFNSPSLTSITETIFMLCSCYPERLGHLIVYKPSFILHTVFGAVKYLVDTKTLSKFHYISGDVTKGSENSNLLDTIIGENWREITGSETTSISLDGCAKGYNHAEYWPANLERIQELKSKSIDFSSTQSSIGNSTASSTTTAADVKVTLSEAEIITPAIENNKVMDKNQNNNHTLALSSTRTTTNSISHSISDADLLQE